MHASAAKAAIDSITRTLGMEWGSEGIRTVGVAPGPVADTAGMTKLAPGMTGKEALSSTITLPFWILKTEDWRRECHLLLLCRCGQWNDPAGAHGDKMGDCYELLVFGIPWCRVCLLLCISIYLIWWAFQVATDCMRITKFFLFFFFFLLLFFRFP